MNDQELTGIAVDFVLTMMSSASTDNIRPLDWWTRARSALEVSAAVAESWPQMVAKFGSKVQIVAVKGKTSHKLAHLGKGLSEGDFDRFRYLAQRDALFVVAMAQVKRDSQKEVRKQDTAHYGERALVAEDRIRCLEVDNASLLNKVGELTADNKALRGTKQWPFRQED